MKFDKNKYKIISQKNWMIIHWILNPGLVINELVLGQRVPKVQLEDKTSPKPRIERSFIPCPHCDKLHDSRIWSTQNGTAFRNWFGLYCPDCGEIIPCVLNIFSFIVLALTIPFWWWFRKSMREKWLSVQPQRFENIQLEELDNPFEKKNWISTGIAFGIIMFILISVLFPLILQVPIHGKGILYGLLICSIGGLVYGLTLKWYMGVRGSSEGD